MLIKTNVKTIVDELNEIKRPKPNDNHVLKSLGHRRFSNVQRIKAFFKLLKAQDTRTVILDFCRDNELKIIFNEGCSEYTLFNKAVV